ncbi:signal transduction histidine kinase [Aeromicrobium panaciterrae]|uniref:histidine kinase n=1 Tax=Aeromicrobium panaciterrae TaxID=363861 RepID=A0ABU1UR87_9ACTN|nr:histidine kinase [Aeromicrobium panaciterrae]MDR7087705.1 signal transduction histidine kinase [Aeromicrobium panaciterrae]
MSVLLAAAIVFGVSAAVAGWFILKGSTARSSGTLMLLGGVATLGGCAAVQLELDGAAAVLFRAAGCLAIPAALALFPRPRWSEPLGFVLITVVVSAGVIATTWASAVESMGFVIVPALLLGVWWGLERGDQDERRALTWSSLVWITCGLVATLIGFVRESAESAEAFDIASLAVFLASLGPPAMVIGVLRPELVDVRGLVTRAVVAATVLFTFLAVAIGLISVIEDLRGQPLQAAPVAVLCAVLAFGVRPLQVTLRGVVDQLLFGDRPDALTAASSLADRIGDDPVLALAAIREALVLPYASLRVGDETLATSGSEVTHTRALPLRLGNDLLGEVVVGLRPGDLGLSAADEDVLRIVAPLLAQTLRARALASDLKESRGAAITAIEEERRRLRRDIHDGLGPTLSGVAFSADAARNQIRSAPERAEELLLGLRADTAGAILEIRRLVEGLRPPALDELGLFGAVRQHAAALLTDGGAPLQVDISTPDDLPTVSAAVEVAAYRIVIEALTNVARHADATRASVSFTCGDENLLLEVRDDGHSIGAWTSGVGVKSMRERAEGVGGSLTAGPGTNGGRVRATLPL